ncbi:MAG: hypothetical protein C0403_13555 [Desulfobacterium sp.]|nr:hypothetical protein [Desulfobacterium sp.]
MATVSKKYQRNHYDQLAKIRQKSNVPFSCGFDERYNPFLLVNDAEIYQYFTELLSQRFPAEKGVVLDCCSGSGIYLPLIAAFSKRLVGIDLSFGLLRESKKIIEWMDSAKTSILQSEAESIPMKSDSCDLVVMIDSFHHIEHPESVLKELFRVAKKNATFLLIEPNIINPLVFLSHIIPKEERGAIRRNTRKKLVKMISPYVQNLQITPMNYVASNKSGFIGQFFSKMTAKLFAHIFTFWPIRLLIIGQFSKEK